MNQLRSLFSNRSFLSVWAASAVSGLGDKIAIVALYLVVYHLSGRAVDLGLLAAVQILPAIFLGPVAGLILDRYSRKKVLVVSDVGSALIVATLPFATTLAEIYLLAGLLAAGRQFAGPARLAILPDIVPDGELDKANALTMTTRNVVLLLGPAAGGALVALGGTSSAFWADAATFLASALLLITQPFVYLTRRTPAVPGGKSAEGRVLLRAWQGIRQGAATVLQQPRLRFAFFFMGATVFVTAMQTPLVVLFLKKILARGDPDLGFMLSAAGLGGIVGALTGGMFRAGKRPLRTVTWLLAVDGLLLVAFAVNVNFLVALALFGLFGAIGTVAQISLATFLQREAPRETRGRVFGWLGSLMGPLSLVSVFAGAVAADAVGVVLVLALSGLFELVVGLVGWLRLAAVPARPAIACEPAAPAEPREMAGKA